MSAQISEFKVPNGTAEASVNNAVLDDLYPTHFVYPPQINELGKGRTIEDLLSGLGIATETSSEIQDLWDEQLEKDAKEGKLDNLRKRAIEAYKKGNVTDL